MGVEEVFLVVDHRPSCHDGSSAAHDSRQAFVDHVGVGAECAGMDGEVVHTLLGLLYERVAVYLPREALHAAVHLFESLVYRHSAYGHRTVADDPFARFVYVGSGGEIHKCVAAPVAAPHGFAYLLLDARRQSRVADVGVELHGEFAAYDHRLRFGMIGIGRDHGASGGHLLSHRFRSDVALDAESRAVHVLADGHILHFRSDDTSPGEIHLRDAATLFSSQRTVAVGEPYRVERPVGFALTAVFRGDFRQLLEIVAPCVPLFADARESAVDVGGHIRIGINAACVVDVDRFVLPDGLRAVGSYFDRWGEYDTAHAYFHIGVYLAVHVCFLRAGIAVEIDIVDSHNSV